MKKRIITVLITIFTVIPLVLITPKAASSTTSTTTVTSYGQYFYTYGCSDSGFDLPIIGRVAWNSGSYITFTYEFLREYDGYINFTLKSNKAFAWQNCYFTVEGGVFTSQPNMTNSSNTKTFQIQFQNSTGFTLTIAKQEAFTLVSDSTFGTNTSITLGTYNFNTVPDVPDTLYHISDRFDFYIPGMSTSLSHIDSDLDNISQNIQALSPYIDQLESYVDGLEGLLSTIRDYTNNLNYILRFNNIEPWQYNALCWPWYNTNANTITYSYERGLIYFNYSTSNNNGTYYDPKCIKIPAYGHLGFYFYTDKAISSADVHFYASNNNTDLSGMVLQNNFFQSGGPYYKNLIHFENMSNSYIYLTLEFTKDMKIYPLFLGNINNTPDEVADLYGIEYGNTYTRLLQSINNGIGALNDDYDTSTYDNYEQTLDGLNDGLRGRFDNVDDTMQNNVNTLFTPSGTAGSDGSIFEKFNFNGVNSVFTGILNGIFTSFPAFKYILLFALLLLVIGVMV